MNVLTSLMLERRSALWNAMVPKRATRVEVGKTYTRYLHPTKGWRVVANARLGL